MAVTALVGLADAIGVKRLIEGYWLFLLYPLDYRMRQVSVALISLVQWFGLACSYRSRIFRCWQVQSYWLGGGYCCLTVFCP